MKIETILLTFVINSDEEITDIINNKLMHYHITSDNLIDIKLNCDNGVITVLIIYKLRID